VMPCLEGPGCLSDYLACMVKGIAIVINALLGVLVFLNYIEDSYSREYEPELLVLSIILFANVWILTWKHEAKDLVTLYFRRKALEQQKKIDKLQATE
jgi:hypothetical protein